MTPERDDDIPVETRRELMQCAVGNGRISYYYLCDVFRRGRESAKAVDAVDPHADSTGTLSTRDDESSSSSRAIVEETKRTEEPLPVADAATAFGG